MTNVTGQPRTWLRLEGAAVFVASVVAYKWQLGSWRLFALLFLAPDLTIAAYLAGPTVGARFYNLAHNYVVPLFLASYSIYVSRSDVVVYALIWTAHIGLDRFLGLGLKYPEGFRQTHLGGIGRRV